MNRQTTIDRAKQLSVADRIDLIQGIWETVLDDQDQVMVTEEQREELDRRFDSYHSAPDAVSSWATVRDRIQTAE